MGHSTIAPPLSARLMVISFFEANLVMATLSEHVKFGGSDTVFSSKKLVISLVMASKNSCNGGYVTSEGSQADFILKGSLSSAIG